jgi:AcrR family transcriptional regulator
VDFRVSLTNVKRAYRQTSRAEATRRTRERILDATDELFQGDSGAALTLEQVAAGADTTVMTVLRHFGSRDGLIAAGAERFRGRLQADRDLVPTGDLDAITRYLDEHYEQTGRGHLRLYPLEETSPPIGSLLEHGRELHRRWVVRVLAPHLDGLDGEDLTRRTALLVVATDLLTWRLLRLEQGLDRPGYRAAVLDLLRALRPADPPPG